MTTLISNQAQWQQILRRQKLANAQHWLMTLEQAPDPAEFALREYDNLFKAFEFTLCFPDTVDLAYRYIIALNPIVFGFADWDRWLKYLEQALQLSQKAQRTELEVRLRELYADFLIHMGFPKKALTYYEDVKGVYKNENDLDRFARILTKLATEYGRYGDPSLAKQYMEQAVAIANKQNDAELSAHVYLDLSAFEMRNQNFEASIAAGEVAYKLYQKLDNERFMLRVLINKAACLARLGQWDQVNNLFEQLVDKMDESSEQINLVRLKNNLGLAAFDQGNLETAESYWQEALQLAEQIHSPIEMGFLYCNLGLVYNHLEEWEYAEKMHHKALLTFSQLGDTVNWANAVENLAELYLAQKRGA